MGNNPVAKADQTGRFDRYLDGYGNLEWDEMVRDQESLDRIIDNGNGLRPNKYLGKEVLGIDKNGSNIYGDEFGNKINLGNLLNNVVIWR